MSSNYDSDQQIYAGYAMVDLPLARPTFRELAPYASFDFVGDFTLIGNKDLKRTLVNNCDLRWERTAAPGWAPASWCWPTIW